MSNLFIFFAASSLCLIPLYQISFKPNQSSTLFFFWVLFCGYHIFVLLNILIIDLSHFSHFYGAIQIDDKVILISSIYILMFVLFFNLEIPKMRPVNVNKKIPICIFFVLLLMSPFYYIKYLELNEIVNLSGYTSLYVTGQSSKFLNFFSKYLPFILLMTFLVTNQSKKWHFTFILPLICVNLPVFLTGQRTIFIMFLILWMIILIDVFIKSYKTKIFIYLGVPIIIFALAFLGLAIRGSEFKDLSHLLLMLAGFSKPMNELVYMVNLSLNNELLHNIDPLKGFPIYSYYCDYGSLITFKNLCLSATRATLPGMLIDFTSAAENYGLYLIGGTAGGGLLSSLVSLDSNTSLKIIYNFVYFIIIVFGISKILNLIFKLFSLKIYSNYVLVIFGYCKIFLTFSLLLSISSDFSRLIPASRFLIYSILIFVLVYLVKKIFENVKSINLNLK